MPSVSPLLMLDLEGLQVSDVEKDLLSHPGTGGLILFTRNYQDRQQLAELVRQIRAVRPEILIAVDQEGGRVQRFRDGFVRLPPMAALGRRYDQTPQLAMAEASLVGELMASELTELDIDLSFAPVLDLDYGTSTVIGDRSFHGDADAMIALAGAFIDGMSAAGMAATGKHFPGHGHVVADSHLELPVDPRPLAEIEAADLRPFVALAQKLDGIMPAHVIYSAVENQTAGFSRYWLQTRLREQMGFRGVIFSDDLSMAGAHGVGGYAERARAALEAGCDMVLACNNRTGAEQVLDFLAGTPFSGQVPASGLRARSRRPMETTKRHAATELAAALTEPR
ncbi:Beta-hexosaminidase [Alcanivorax jadensis T9]|jgi:beta-N-acetylhexosaminidase|uniref:Beta-hexosaminidase n=1 Tax=Alcanivorax jadensis T9 TaxID=1177181 RepID=A0ABR4WCV2_9GAMM|nr:beta-N-acetylhexosaminidase [Alcanivorax jadensis]KGD61289.1 Beta-hexosaminidase [Alcanivorax jadensis T9]|tara:strand:+ start:288 stop:1301 length:1014 start_codon:yes stop_codon:yes gene_type:complete